MATTSAVRDDGSTPRRGFPATLTGEFLFHQLLEKLPAGAYTCDVSGLITYYNAAAVQVWGRAPAINDPTDRFCGSFRLYASDGTPITHADCWTALALRNQRDYIGEEIMIERPDGRRLTALAHASPIHDDNGALVGAVNVLVDISDRKRAEDALRDADRAKNEFLATMSHEIRTPINAILGYADLLDVEVAGPLVDGQRAHLTRIQAAGRHLLSLVTEVLDLAKVESGQMTVRRESYPAMDAAEMALAVIQPLAAARGIALVNRCGADRGLTYLGDEDRVRQILINLVSNGIKFSEPGQRVEVTCERCGQLPDHVQSGSIAGPWVSYRVRDSGIGIAEEQLEHIFEPFVQVEGRTTRTRGGTGLGLTITRRLARLMGGDLTVESAIGSGSVFVLWLPAADRLAPRDPHAGLRVPTPIEMRDPAAAFAAVGHALLQHLDEIRQLYIERLRSERIGPGAQSLSDARLANHVATLLSDIAVTLLGLGDRDGPADTAAAGSEIQRVGAIAHGRQRGHLGWTEADLDRGYAALWDAVVQCVGDVRASAAERESALVAIRRRLERAKSYSLCGLQSVRSGG